MEHLLPVCPEFLEQVHLWSILRTNIKKQTTPLCGAPGVTDTFAGVLSEHNLLPVGPVFCSVQLYSPVVPSSTNIGVAEVFIDAINLPINSL